MLTDSSNCISTEDLSTSGTITLGPMSGGVIASQPLYYPYPITPSVSSDIVIKQVENGWVLTKLGKDYIISKPEQILQYLTKKESK